VVLFFSFPGRARLALRYIAKRKLCGDCLAEARMPQIDKDRRLSAAEFGQWVSAYNNAGINVGCMPPQDALEQARTR
jgi:hypothetical protein